MFVLSVILVFFSPSWVFPSAVICVCSSTFVTTFVGNGFVYDNENVWGIFAGVVRALETFKFPYDWKHIVRVGLGSMKENAVSVED